MQIVLASGSTYRQSILSKLHISFTSVAPNIDETPTRQETIISQVARLAENKAKVIARQSPYQNSYVIGSDQLASCEGKILGKPGDLATAIKQLQQASGREVIFYTGLCLIHESSNQLVQMIETYTVKFKTLTDKQISTYLNIEQPFDCAGSFKSEGLGIALFESLQGRDPNTLIGLPLIGLIELFKQLSIDLFDFMEKP